MRVLITLARDLKSTRKNGNQVLHVMKKKYSVDCASFCSTMENIGLLEPDQSVAAPAISTQTLTLKQQMASTDKDEQLIKYAATSHLSAKQVKEMYGIANHKTNKTKIQETLMEVKSICSAYDVLARTTDQALLKSMGIFDESPKQQLMK